MRMSKIQSNRIHAKKRAWRRYGLVLNRNDLREIVQKIQAGRGTCLGRTSLARSKWQVEHQGRTLVVVYDKKRHVVITVLPRRES